MTLRHASFLKSSLLSNMYLQPATTVLMGVLMTHGPLAIATESSTATPNQVVTTLENKFGVHAGQRRNHTKGHCFSGYFEASDLAAQYTRSPIFSGQRVDVVGRFSHAGGNPHASDIHSRVFGMALQMTLPQTSGDVVHKMAMLDIPYFDVSTPEGFLAKQRATTPITSTGKPSPDAIAQFEQHYPESQRLKQHMKTHPRTPVSYTQLDFHSIHTFILENTSRKQQPVRWRFEPADGVKRVQNSQQGNDFLGNELSKRLADQPAHFRMQVIRPAPDDALIDPSIPWQGTGSALDFGTLTLTQADGPCESINFDPLMVSDGVMPSSDPVLRFRSPAYAISWAKRRAESRLSQPSASKKHGQ